MPYFRRLIIFIAVVVCSLVAITSNIHAQTYRIIYTNNTPQTLTSSVCAIHARRVTIFNEGEPASTGLKVLAEDGVNTTFARELRGLQAVRAVVSGNFVSPGNTRRVSITPPRGGRASCVLGMLGITNDGFVAFKGVRLPKEVGSSRRFDAYAYDAGTEQNSESCDHVPGGPCDAHFVGIAENGNISRHQGILGIADLSSMEHGWQEPAVTGRIRRIN